MRSKVRAVTWASAALAGESARVAMATRVVSGLVALLASAVPLAVSVVAGMSVEGQAAILGAVDSAGARIITVTSAGQAPVLPASAVDRVASLSGVTWVLGLGPVEDVRSGLGVGPAPLRAIRAVRAPVAFGTDRIGGSVFVSKTSAGRLGLAGAYGAVFPGALPVAGWFRSGESLEALDAFVLAPSTDDTLRLERIVVLVDDAGWVDRTIASIRRLIGANAAANATIAGSYALLAARTAVTDEVVRRDRQLVLLLLAAAMVLACLVVSAGTIGSRRDFGRRRALGASRGQLALLVMAATLWPALLGAAVGVLAGWAYIGSQLGHLADPQFPVAVGVLAVLGVTAISGLPAVHAATRDPLRVLRVP